MFRNVKYKNLGENMYSKKRLFTLHIYIYILLSSAVSVENADRFSAECKAHSLETSVQDLTLNHQIVRLQSWSFAGMWRTRSLLLLPVPLWPGVVVSVRVLSIYQIELFNLFLYLEPFNCIMLNKLSVQNSNTWNHLTVCKQTRFVHNSYIFNTYMYKHD